MQQIVVGKKGIIKNGILKGSVGFVVGYDSETDVVEIKVDDYSTIITSSDNVHQGAKD